MEHVAACIRSGARTEEAVGDATGAGTSCGGCLDRICAMITDVEPSHGIRRVQAAV